MYIDLLKNVRSNKENRLVLYLNNSQDSQLEFLIFQVNREIQQRSPISGSRRPSISSMLSTSLHLGTNNLITAQLQRRLSDIAHSPGHRRQAASPEARSGRARPRVRRHASDLAWRPLIQSGNIRWWDKRFLWITCHYFNFPVRLLMGLMRQEGLSQLTSIGGHRPRPVSPERRPWGHPKVLLRSESLPSQIWK